MCQIIYMFIELLYGISLLCYIPNIVNSVTSIYRSYSPQKIFIEQHIEHDFVLLDEV